MTPYHKKLLARLLFQAVKFKPIYKRDIEAIAEQCGVLRLYRDCKAGQTRMELESQVEMPEERSRRIREDFL